MVRTRRRLTDAARLTMLGALFVGITLLTPPVAAAHAALDIATPADGAAVEGTPAEVAGTYTQTLETDGSSIQLRDAAGTVIATGGVDPTDDRRLVIVELPPLARGEYEVRSTTLSAEDGEIDRATWTFSVTAAPTPSPSPTPAPTDAPSAAPSAGPSVTAAPTPTDHEEPTGVSDTEAILPIIAGLAIVLIAGVVLLGRRGRTGRGT